MYKRSKFLLFLSIIQLLVLVFSIFMFLIDTSNSKYLTVLIITFICTILFLLCFIYVYKEEKKSLQNREFLDFKLEVVNRDHLQEIRKLLDKTEISNSLQEAELLKKYEKISLEYEKKGNFYIIFEHDEVVALMEVIRNFKNKTISFNVVESKLEDLSEVYSFLAVEEKLTLKD